MTISTNTESQISAALASQQKKETDAKAEVKADSDTANKAAEAPAVVLDAKEAEVDEKLAASAEALDNAQEALAEAQALSAALAQQNSSIANSSPGQVAGLLSEFEAAAA
jgi:hypothetical protein